ncbi:MAG: mercuric reductase [Spirochaetaceae bacterium]|nr:MAG: mercuric reductase [Spirochaetaceae bacterium]
MKHYDVILIGTGQATGTLVAELLNRNLTIATIERDRVGGSCVNWGCTPTKTMVASARAAHMARRGADFGVDVAGVAVRFEKVMQRVNAMRVPASDGFQSWLEEATDFYPGSARFEDDRTLSVGDARLRGETIVIHTGTRARTPSIPGIESVNWLDNRGVLDLAEIPEHLLVLGGSYIGLEFAQAYRRFGSRVTVLEHNQRIVTREDPDISDIALEVLSAEGIEFQLGAEALQLAAGKQYRDGVALSYSQGDRQSTVEGSHILIAVGRVPNSDDLNLEAAGVATNERGFITVDDVGRTSVPHIYAIGDVNGRGAFTHTSVHDGQVFLDHLALGSKKISDRTPIHSMFIDPPLARVGMSETEVRASGKKALMATMPMSKVNRAREKDETAGLVKVVVEAGTNKILGATIFGVGGDEIIGMLALAMQAGLPYSAIQDTVLPHPTVAELIPWVFADLKPIT